MVLSDGTECNCDQALELKSCNVRLRAKIGELESKSLCDDEKIHNLLMAIDRLSAKDIEILAENERLRAEIDELKYKFGEH